MLSSVTLASASGLGSFCVVICSPLEALLLGTQAEGPGHLLDVLEPLPRRQPAQIGEHPVGGVALLRLGDQGVAVGRPDLLAEVLGQRGAVLDVGRVGAGGGRGGVRVGHALVPPGVEASVKRRTAATGMSPGIAARGTTTTPALVAAAAASSARSAGTECASWLPRASRSPWSPPSSSGVAPTSSFSSSCWSARTSVSTWPLRRAS